jgi:uncharacterized protein (TIRG00374 family)
MTATPFARSWRSPRVWLVLGLLVFVAWYVDPLALLTKVCRADPWLVTLAVVVSMVANFVSATRWCVIARGLGLVAPNARLVRMYARGITTNMLLPGATLSGDLLRSVELSRLGNPLGASALSVVLDRFSGLWVLCVLSLLAGVGIAVRGVAGAGSVLIAPHQLCAYLLVLAGITAAPFIPLRFRIPGSSTIAWISALASRWHRLRQSLRQARPALLASIWQSLGVQCLSACVLWICAMAIGVSLPYLVILAAAAPIFILAAVPIGVAGFGTRELAAVVVLGWAGVPGDMAAAAALLFGLAAVLQGILAAPLFFSRA